MKRHTIYVRPPTLRGNWEEEKKDGKNLKIEPNFNFSNLCKIQEFHRVIVAPPFRIKLMRNKNFKIKSMEWSSMVIITVFGPRDPDLNPAGLLSQIQIENWVFNIQIMWSDQKANLH